MSPLTVTALPFLLHFPCILTPGAPLTEGGLKLKAGAGRFGQTVNPSFLGVSEHPALLIWKRPLGSLCLRETWQTLNEQAATSVLFLARG